MNHDAFDAALIGLIREGRRRYVQFCFNAKLASLAPAVAGDYGRYIDRRLQALRKAGRITYNRKDGWAAP